MPSKSTFFHSHRNTNPSQISLSSQDEKDLDTPHSTISDHHHHHDQGLPQLSEEAGFYQLTPGPVRPQSRLTSGPTRSQSHRLPTSLNTNTQPSVNLQSTPNSAVEDDNPDHYYQQPSRAPVHKAEQKKRSFFRLGGSSRDVSKDKTEKIGRSTSTRRKVPPQQPESHNTDARSRTDYERWSPSEPLADAEEPERYATFGGKSLLIF